MILWFYSPFSFFIFVNMLIKFNLVLLFDNETDYSTANYFETSAFTESTPTFENITQPTALPEYNYVYSPSKWWK
jgi:hypothetical protein